MRTLEEIRQSISEKESELETLRSEIQSLREARSRLEEQEQQEFFRRPEPGDFWHDCYSPVLVVLGVGEGGVVVSEKTLPVYEDADSAMILKSYATPNDPEVKAYFAKPRKLVGYTFDLESARTVSKDEFKSLLKCYGSMPEELTYRCIRGGRPSVELVRRWGLLSKVDN